MNIKDIKNIRVLEKFYTTPIIFRKEHEQNIIFKTIK